MPAAVPTPLPPRNPANTVQMWPTTAADPARTWRASRGTSGGAGSREIRSVASTPLPTSTIIVGIPPFHP